MGKLATCMDSDETDPQSNIRKVKNRSKTFDPSRLKSVQTVADYFGNLQFYPKS